MLSFLRSEWRFLGFGFLVAFWSSPGQTFFISLFGDHVRQDFGLTHGSYGTLYMVGTLASAACLWRGGRLVDQLPLARFIYWLVLAMALAVAGFSFTSGLVFLTVSIFTLRFFGQGMMSHTSVTAMARRYETFRGRAVSISSLGYTLGEAVFPPLVVFLLGLFYWRDIWLLVAAVLLVTTLPFFPFLLRRTENQDGSGADALVKLERRQWTRGEMLRDRRFHFLLPLVMANAMIVTGVFFHQVYIVELKGWDLSVWAFGFSAYALAAVVGSLLTGVLVDRFSARVMSPLALVPLIISLIALTLAQDPLWGIAAMAVMGFGGMAENTALTSLWAELYGTDHLGAIRAVATVTMVFASALGPVILGLGFDAGLGVGPVFLGAACYCLLAVGFAVLGVRQRHV